jgi:GNAT superfamily N-acetyltransferase
MISNEGIAANLYDLYNGLAKRGLVSSGSVGGFDFVRRDGFEWPNMAYRSSGVASLPSREEFRLLQELMASHQCPRLVILDMEGLTAEAQEVLAEERLIAAGEWVNMALPLGRSKPVGHGLLQCREIDADDPDEWSGWASVVSNVLFKGGMIDAAMFRDREMKKRFVLMAAFADGVPVAACLLNLGENAGLYMVATLKSFQGKGFGKVLMEYAQAKAAARGYEFVVLHSTKAGLNLYNNLGYRTFGKLILYYAMPQKQ